MDLWEQAYKIVLSGSREVWCVREIDETGSQPLFNLCINLNNLEVHLLFYLLTLCTLSTKYSFKDSIYNVCMMIALSSSATHFLISTLAVSTTHQNGLVYTKGSARMCFCKSVSLFWFRLRHCKEFVTSLDEPIDVKLNNIQRLSETVGAIEEHIKELEWYTQNAEQDVKLGNYRRLLMQSMNALKNSSGARRIPIMRCQSNGRLASRARGRTRVILQKENIVYPFRKNDGSQCHYSPTMPRGEEENTSPKASFHIHVYIYIFFFY